MAFSKFAQHRVVLGTNYNLNPNGSYAQPPSSVFVDVWNDGEKSSIGHPGPPFRSGGPFLVRKVSRYLYPGGSGSWSGNGTGGSQFRYDGSFVPALTPNWYNQTGVVPTTLGSASWGATGFARARPGSPTASVGQFLIELRDLPRLPLIQLQRFRDLGSEYLNVVFGWKPFVRDLQSMYMTYRNLRHQLERLVAHRNKRIRKRLTVGASNNTSTTTSIGISGNMYVVPILGTSYGTNARLTTTDTVKTDYRFTGAFKYWINDIGPDLWSRKATYALFGLNPTPKLLWDVIPWTWLIGWFSNIGDVFANMSENALDSLVADYAFMTGKQTRSIVYDVDFNSQPYRKNFLVRHRCSSEVRHTVIERVQASPYGFGIHSASMSAGQIAILGALGISRHF